MEVTQKSPHFSPMVLFSPPTPISKAEMLGRITAHIGLIEAALHPFGHPTSIPHCLHIHSGILEQVSMLFQDSTNPHIKDIGTHLRETNNALSPRIPLETQKLFLRYQRAVLQQFIPLLQQPPSQPMSDSNLGPSSSSSIMSSSRPSPVPIQISWNNEPNITDEEARRRLACISGPISSVSLQHCFNLTDTTLRLIADKSYKLTVLGLCGKTATEATLRLFAEKCDQLVFLTLASTAATDATLQLFAENTNKLKRLGLSKAVTEATIETFVTRNPSLEGLWLYQAQATPALMSKISRPGLRIVIIDKPLAGFSAPAPAQSSSSSSSASGSTSNYKRSQRPTPFFDLTKDDDARAKRARTS